MAELPLHRQIGRAAGEIRSKLQRRVARRGMLTQDHLAELSAKFHSAADVLARQTISDIERAGRRPVSREAVARYLELLQKVAAGEAGIPASPDVDQELRTLTVKLLGFDEEVIPCQRSAPATLDIPRRAFDRGRSPPAALLRSEYEVVPFHGREAELTDLLDWCTAPHLVGLRLYTGPGGMGKTRLMIEACRTLYTRGSNAGFLQRALTSAECAELWNEDRPTLVVIDYADTRRELLLPILSTLHQANPSHPARVVLLARSADDWWHYMKTTGEGVGELISSPATRRIALAPLALDERERAASYRLAVQAFAALLGAAAPRTVPADLSAPEYDRALLLHMAALASLHGVETTGEAGLLDFILNRERRFWQTRAAGIGLPETIAAGIGQGMAAITLSGGAPDRQTAERMLSRVPFFSDAPQPTVRAVASILHEAYPGMSWIEPMLPDILGEHLVQTELADNADPLLDLVFGSGDAS